MLFNSANKNQGSKNVMCQVMPGRAVTKVEGGYNVEAKQLPQGKGFVPEENRLAIGSEILVKVVGQHQGMPLLHPVFGGFR